MSKQPKKIDPRNVEDILSLTPLQEGMLFHYLSNPDTPLYFEQLSLSLSGELDPALFRQAWDLVMQKNEALRAVFRWEKVEQPVQVILKTRDLPLAKLDLTGAASERQPELLAEIRQKDRDQLLDLSEAPFRMILCKLSSRRHELIISSHHILYDGWSNGIILNEFLQAYHALAAGTLFAKPVKPKFKEFIKWLRSQNPEGLRAYWKEYLQGFGSKTGLPVDLKKFSEITKLAQYTCQAPDGLMTQIEGFLKERGITLATLLYGVWGILLQCYNDTDDVCFGTTVSGREAVIPGIEELVGLFINTIPLRFHYDPELTVAEVFSGLSRDLRRRSENELAALTEIKACSELDKQEALFDTIVVVDNYPLPVSGPGETDSDSASLRIDSYSIFEMTHFDLTLQIYTFGSLELHFNYNQELFHSETIQRMAGHFQNILQAVLKQPKRKLQELDWLSEAEKGKLLFDLNHTRVPYPKDRLIPELIAAHAVKTPERIAVVFEGRQLTYGELNSLANQLAAMLISYGVKPGDMIGLLMPRSVEMIAGMLGILKAGAVCVPLDTEHPDDRIQTILEDSGAGILLELAGHNFLPGYRGTKLEFHRDRLATYPATEPEPRIRPDELAYLIYTSGSTGKPKGAMLHHFGIINHVLTKIDVLEITAADIVGNNFSINVIAAIWQILAPLFTGARLIVYAEAVEKDPYLQFEKVAADQVSVIEVIPSVVNAYLNLLEKGGSPISLPRLRKIALTSEETKSFLVNKFYRYYRIPLVDCYGQTECCDDTLHYEIPYNTETTVVPIGKPSHNTRVYILNRHHQLQPVGIIGELCISGDGVGRGYWNKPELSTAKFMPNPYEPGQLMYRTGDLACWRPDGLVAYLGRIDHQVKIRGNRIELGEIESQLLKHPAIRETVVVAREDERGDSYLAAFLVADPASAATEAAGALTVAEIRGFLAKTIPDYMIPAQFVQLAQLPLTPNGKVDRKRLPRSESNIATGHQFVPPGTGVEKQLAAIWGQILHKDKVGIHDNFFDLGGHSLLLIQVKNKIQEAFGQEIPIVEMFRYSTISLLVDYLNQQAGGAAVASAVNSRSSKIPKPIAENAPEGASEETLEGTTGVAIIGMAGYFPGAKDLGEFWNNLMDGRETISRFADDELEGLDSLVIDLADPSYVKAYGALEGIDRFDAAFFGLNPREAELTDPQQRLFLQCAWEALENAGYNPDRYSGKIGVYAGVGMNTYLLHNLLPEQEAIRTAGDFQTVMGNDKDFVATRVSYKLNLKGPSLTAQTACSTSMVAAHLAYRGIMGDECQIALAGAAFIRLPQKTAYRYQDGGNLSPDGHCRTFDHSAQGTVFGNGVGVVALKRLADACRDGDQIYAVIKGSALNNDGGQKVSYTAPGVDGQAEAIGQAIKSAGVNPETIGYVEAHGTATTLGDPIEIAALTKAFRQYTAQKSFCAVGTVKTNIGHLDVAAGMAGLIKTALALHHRQIPPSLHFNRPNPAIDFPDSPFYVNDRPVEWGSKTKPRRAGVSCFGIGGTNVHMVLEEAPCPEASETTRPGYLLPLSARSAAALETMTRNLAVWLSAHPEHEIADVAYTLQTGRREFPYRRIILCRDRDEAIVNLEKLNPAPEFTGNAVVGDAVNGDAALRAPKIALSYDHPAEIPWKTLREFYRQEPAFQRHFDTNSQPLRALTGFDGLPILQGAVPLESDRPDELRLGPMIWLVIEHSIIQTLHEWGIRPQALLGYRTAEVIGACLAGVFSLEDALKLLNGSSEQMALEISHITLNPPRIPFVSSLTGTWIQPSQALQPEYWVNFSRWSSETGGPVLRPTRVETGLDPDYLLVRITAENPVGGTAAESGVGIRQFPEFWQFPELREYLTLWPTPKPDSIPLFGLNWLGKLWLRGVQVDWNGFYAGEKRRRVGLPSYPFEKGTFWIAPPSHKSGMTGPKPEQFPGMVKDSDLAQWTYLPVWKQAPLLTPAGRGAQAQPEGIWLLFMDKAGLGEKLRERLEAAQRTVITVTVGNEFGRIHPAAYVLNPRRPEDYLSLLLDLDRAGRAPDRIIHLWNITGSEPEGPNFERFLDYQYLGFYSLLFLAQAWNRQAFNRPLTVEILSDGVHDLAGTGELIPDKTTVWAACAVITQEYPALFCRCLDLSPGDLRNGMLPGAARQIFAEILAGSSDRRIAYCRGERWVRAYQKADLTAAQTETPPVLRTRGVYLITGGLGNIGFAIAGYLVRTVAAKLILVGRSAFPDRDQWEDWLRDHPEGDPVSLKITAICQWESRGAEILILSGDISDLEGARAIITKANQRFGGIHGVIHAAGITGAQAVTSIAETTPQISERQFLPKIKGFMNLTTVLEQETVDFYLCISSLASVLGGLGSAAYTAAHVFLDEFAYQRNSGEGGRFLSINWDAWRFHSRKTGGLNLDRFAMEAEEGITLLDRILKWEGFSQLVVSTGPLELRQRQSLSGSLTTSNPESGLPAVRSGHQRPALATTYQPAGNQVERILCQVWEELIGVQPVGIMDNFFELGGHSLMATQFISRVKDIFRVELPIGRLFDAPSVQELAAAIRELWGGFEQAEEVAATYLELRELSAADIKLLLEANESVSQST